MDFGQDKSTQDFLTKWQNFRIAYMDSSSSDTISESGSDTHSRRHHASAPQSGNKPPRQTNQQVTFSPPTRCSKLKTSPNRQALTSSLRKKGGPVKKHRRKHQEGEVLTVEDDDTLIFKLHPRPSRLFNRNSNAISTSLPSRKKEPQPLSDVSSHNTHIDPACSLTSQPLPNESKVFTENQVNTPVPTNAPKRRSREWEGAVNSCFQKQGIIYKFEGLIDSSPLMSQPLPNEPNISTENPVNTAAPTDTPRRHCRALEICCQKQERRYQFEGSPDSSERLDELGEESMPEQCSDPEDEASLSLNFSAIGDTGVSNANKVPSLERPPIIASLFNGIPPFLRFVKENETVGQFPPFLSDKLIWRNSTLTPNVVKRALWRSNFTILNMGEECLEEYEDTKSERYRILAEASRIYSWRQKSRKLNKTNSARDEDQKDTRDTWIGYFGRHFTAKSFRYIRDYQKINHFPGSFNLGRKDRLTLNLQRMKTRFGAAEYNFYPPTFILPREYNRLKEFWEEYITEDQNSSNAGVNRMSAPRWILKPPACARGIGVYVVNKFTDVPSRKRLLAQLYLIDPFLINGSKFDLRVYVYVSCVDPLQLYIHKTGLVRFASQKYSKSPQNVSNRFIHLTNYSVNKKSGCYRPSGDAHTENAHKWELRELWKYLRDHGHDSERIWEDIKMLVFKTVASVVSHLASNVIQFVACRESVHELFGFDILLDSALKPWLLEVNVSPSLHTSSALDNKIKTEVVVDMLNIAGYRFPPMPKYFKSDGTLRQCRTLDLLFEEARNASLPGTLQPSSQPLDACKDSARTEGVQNDLLDRSDGDGRLYPLHDPYLLRMPSSQHERVKHRTFTAKNQSSRFQKTILEKLTPGDTLVLVNVINEWYRASLGNYERIFPRGDEKGIKMMPYIDSSGGDGLSVPSGHIGSPRYYDVLVHQFLRKYADVKEKSDENPIDIEAVASTDILEDQGMLTRIAECLHLKPEGITKVATAVQKFLKTRVTANDIAAEWMGEMYNKNNAPSECNSPCSSSTQPSVSRSSVSTRPRLIMRKHRLRKVSHSGLPSSNLSNHGSATPSKRCPTPISKAPAYNPVLELGVFRRSTSMRKQKNKAVKVVSEVTPRSEKRKEPEKVKATFKFPIPAYTVALPATQSLTQTSSSTPVFRRVKRQGQVAKVGIENIASSPRGGSSLRVSGSAEVVPSLPKLMNTENIKNSSRSNP